VGQQANPVESHLENRFLLPTVHLETTLCAEVRFLTVVDMHAKLLQRPPTGKSLETGLLPGSGRRFGSEAHPAAKRDAELRVLFVPLRKFLVTSERMIYILNENPALPSFARASFEQCPEANPLYMEENLRCRW
jgi:hypothetical protein